MSLVAAKMPVPSMLVGCMSVVMVGRGLVLPTTIAQALAVAEVPSGYRAAALGALQMAGSGLMSLAVAHTAVSISSISWLLRGLTLACVLCCRLARTSRLSA